MSSADGDGRPRDDQVRRIIDAVRRKVAEVRAEAAPSRLTVEPYTPPKLRPRILPSPDELLAEMIAERDETYRRAEEALAHADRLRLDVDAAARRQQGRELLQ
jgi:hypothetical protein